MTSHVQHTVNFSACLCHKCHKCKCKLFCMNQVQHVISWLTLTLSFMLCSWLTAVNQSRPNLHSCGNMKRRWCNYSAVIDKFRRTASCLFCVCACRKTGACKQKRTDDRRSVTGGVFQPITAQREGGKSGDGAKCCHCSYTWSYWGGASKGALNVGICSAV